MEKHHTIIMGCKTCHQSTVMKEKGGGGGEGGTIVASAIIKTMER